MKPCIWLMSNGSFCEKLLPEDQKFCDSHEDPLKITSWFEEWDFGSLYRPSSSPYYDREGKPITVGQWGELRMAENDYIRVGSTRIKGFWVSTTWLGIDHKFGLGPPVIFETMVFRMKRGKIVSPGGFDSYQVRYADYRQAEYGHDNICRMVHSGWTGREKWSSPF
jgi:hypothetical protein